MIPVVAEDLDVFMLKTSATNGSFLGRGGKGEEEFGWTDSWGSKPELLFAWAEGVGDLPQGSALSESRATDKGLSGKPC